MKAYTVLKIIGGLLMILIAAWTVPATSGKMIYGSTLNAFIGFLGLGLMVFLSYLETKGEI